MPPDARRGTAQAHNRNDSSNKDTSPAIALPQGSQIKTHPSRAEKKAKRYGLRTTAHKSALLVDQSFKLKVAKGPHLSRRKKRGNRASARAVPHQDILLAAQFAALHLPDNSTSTPEDTTTVAEISKATEAILTAERALAVLQNAVEADPKDEKQDSQ